MAIPFLEPDPPLNYNGAAECRALDAHFTLRGVPRSQRGRMLLASWNIANLGAQDRPRRALNIIAHILKRFDLVAVQEVNDNFRAFLAVMDRLGPGFDYVLSDTAGNDERLGFVYRKNKVGLEHLFGEIALRPREYPRRNVRVHFRENRRDRFRTLKNFRFVPFDRNPMIGSFVSGNVNFVLANVHLYFRCVPALRQHHEGCRKSTHDGCWRFSLSLDGLMTAALVATLWIETLCCWGT